MSRVGHAWLRVARAGAGPAVQVRRLEVVEPETHGLLPVQDLVARLPCEVRGQIEVAPLQTRVETVDDVRDRAAEEGLVGLGDRVVPVHIGEPEITWLLPSLLGEVQRVCGGLEDPRHFETPEAADRLTDDRAGGESHFVAQPAAQDLRLALTQCQHLVTDRGAVETHLVVQGARLGAPRERPLHTAVTHLRGVHER